MVQGELGSNADVTRPDVALADLALQGDPGSLGALADSSPRKQASLWGDAWRRLIRNRLALIGLIIVTVFIVVAILA
ncbi:MAG: hypothetical protein ACRDHN_20305, partial [Thermomicrobiales bacterium]